MLVESYVHKLKLAVDEALAARSRLVIREVNKLHDNYSNFSLVGNVLRATLGQVSKMSFLS